MNRNVLVQTTLTDLDLVLLFRGTEHWSSFAEESNGPYITGWRDISTLYNIYYKSDLY